MTSLFSIYTSYLLSFLETIGVSSVHRSFLYIYIKKKNETTLNTVFLNSPSIIECGLDDNLLVMLLRPIYKPAEWKKKHSCLTHASQHSPAWRKVNICNIACSDLCSFTMCHVARTPGAREHGRALGRTPAIVHGVGRMTSLVAWLVVRPRLCLCLDVSVVFIPPV